MGAVRLHTTPKGLRVYVDDETLISDEAITLVVMPGHVAPPTALSLTTSEAQELVDALAWAIADALAYLQHEKDKGLR